MNTVESVIKQTENDPQLAELYSIAESLEISLMEKLEDNGMVYVMAYFDHQDKTAVLAVSQNTDRFTAIHEAIGKAIDELEFQQ